METVSINYYSIKIIDYSQGYAAACNRTEMQESAFQHVAISSLSSFLQIPGSIYSPLQKLTAPWGKICISIKTPCHAICGGGCGPIEGPAK